MRNFGYKHIIWDWNGTLFDDAWLCVNTMNILLAGRNLPPLSPARYERIFDFPVIDYYRKLGFDFSVDTFEQLSDEFISVYDRGIYDCELRIGTREILAEGQQRGITQSILSAMEQNMLDTMITHFKLQDFFVDVVGLSDHHAFGKIKTGQRWLAQQPLPSADMLFIGDTVHDYEVAQALDVTCYSIHSGHHSRERLAASGTPVIETLAEIYT